MGCRSSGNGKALKGCRIPIIAGPKGILVTQELLYLFDLLGYLATHQIYFGCELRTFSNLSVSLPDPFNHELSRVQY